MIAQITPVPHDERRPLWSVVVPVHNCAHLLDRALRNVVAELGDRDDAEILVVDDASVDDPAVVVERFGAGRVRFYRNEVGLGAVANFNRCLALTRGSVVHLLHGDDMVKPGFYAAMESALADPGVVAAVCRTEYIDGADEPGAVTRSERAGTGEWTHALERLAVSNRIRPAGIVVRRSAYESVGGFRTDLPHAADWEMWVRLAACGQMQFVDEVLARYRQHDASDTAPRVRSGANIDERLRAIAIIGELVPDDDRRRLARRAAAYSAIFAGRAALGFVRRRAWRPAAAQAAAIVRCVGRVVRPAAFSAGDG